MLPGPDMHLPLNRSFCASLLALAVGAGLGLAAAGCGSGGGANPPAPGVPQLTFSAAALSFGTVTVGASSAAQTLTLTNSGTAALGIASIAVSGEFSETISGCGASLTAGARCQVAVVFSPGAAGARTGTVTVTSNAAGSPQTVALSGTGVAAAAPQLGLSAAALSFGTVAVGSSSAAQTLTLTNSGTAGLNIANIAAGGDFSSTSSGCGASLTPGATCQVSVVFAPGGVGARTGTLSVTSNAAGSPQTVGLSGTGVAGGMPQVSVSATSLSFGTVSAGGLSAAQGLTVSNAGTGVLTIAAVQAGGDFTETSSGCGAGLGPNAACQIAVVFGPTAAGPRTGTLTLATNAPGAAPQVTLSGTGMAATPYAGSPFSVTVQAGTQPVAGSSVQMYAAGNRGNGSAGRALLGAAGTTGATGMAVISGGYSCPSADAQVYVVGRGGTPGSSTGNNANLAFMAAVGRAMA